jgi:hypothetical protein
LAPLSFWNRSNYKPKSPDTNQLFSDLRSFQFKGLKKTCHFAFMNNRAPDWIEILRFERIEHRDFVFDYWPTYEDHALVDKLCVAIADEYRIRKTLPKHHPKHVSPLKWLKPVCYNAVLTCLHYDLFECLEARIATYNRLKRGLQTERSIFMTGMVGIFAHDVTKVRLEGARHVKTVPLINEKERERMAEEMWWGFRHYATPAELVSFNRQYPLHKAQPPKPREFILDQFHDTIIARRVEEQSIGMRVEEERGGYPDSIENAVAARLDEQSMQLSRKRKDADPDW